MALLSLGWFRSGWKGRGLIIIIVATMTIGAATAIGARLQLDHLLTIQSGAAFDVEVSDVEGDCGTPALYILPEPAGEMTRYRILVDFLGGRNRFPQLGGVDATTPVLQLPANRPPGVGLGRGLMQSCRHMRLTLNGVFAYAGESGHFPGVDALPMEANPAVSVTGTMDGELVLDYAPRPGGSEDDALAAFTLENISDLWQYAYKRAGFTNQGSRDLNIFFYEEPGYLFVNATDNVVRPIDTSRSYADAYLSVADDTGRSSVVVYRRKPTSDIELQHALISISTVFGIGVSLFIEGLVFALITLATRRRDVGM